MELLIDQQADAVYGIKKLSVLTGPSELCVLHVFVAGLRNHANGVL